MPHPALNLAKKNMRVATAGQNLEICGALIQGDLKGLPWDFPGGTVVKNPPANAGDMGSIPDPGRSHVPWSN